MRNGYLLTIDYGGLTPEIYCPDRQNGTLICFRQHQADHNPYEDIGKKDITAHVNFSALCHFGKQAGLTTCGYVTQASFLLQLGFDKFIAACEQRECLSATRALALRKTLIADMGQKFKVLIQSKGNVSKCLLGLKTAFIPE